LRRTAIGIIYSVQRMLEILVFFIFITMVWALIGYKLLSEIEDDEVAYKSDYSLMREVKNLIKIFIYIFFLFYFF
jgi:hypothetical protein